MAADPFTKRAALSAYLPALVHTGQAVAPMGCRWRWPSFGSAGRIGPAVTPLRPSRSPRRSQRALRCHSWSYARRPCRERNGPLGWASEVNPDELRWVILRPYLAALMRAYR